MPTHGIAVRSAPYRALRPGDFDGETKGLVDRVRQLRQSRLRLHTEDDLCHMDPHPWKASFWHATIGRAIEETLSQDMLRCLMHPLAEPVLKRVRDAFKVGAVVLEKNKAVTCVSTLDQFCILVEDDWMPRCKGMRGFVMAFRAYLKHKVIQVLCQSVLEVNDDRKGDEMADIVKRQSHQMLLNGRVRQCPVRSMPRKDIVEKCTAFILPFAMKEVNPACIDEHDVCLAITEAACLTAHMLLLEQELSLFEQQGAMFGVAAVMEQSQEHADVAREMFHHPNFLKSSE